MESIPFGVDEVRELVELLGAARNVIGAYVQPAQWDGLSGRIYRECGVKAAELAALATKCEERYAASMRENYRMPPTRD